MGAVWSSERVTKRPFARRKVSIGICMPDTRRWSRQAEVRRRARQRPLGLRSNSRSGGPHRLQAIANSAKVADSRQLFVHRESSSLRTQKRLGFFPFALL